MDIEDFCLYTIHNSRAEQTVAAEINGIHASAPSGASTGSHEASSFVPDDLDSIEQAIQERVAGKQLGQDDFDSLLLDIDGTETFDNIGSVGIAASLAFKKASGYRKQHTFPYPLGNVVGGGEHGGNTSIQEFLVIPVEAETFPEAVETNAAIYREFQERYRRKIRGKNDEGAFITSMNDEETLESLHKVAEAYGARVGIDAAANEMWNGNTYTYNSMGMDLPPNQQKKFMQKLIDEFDLFYVEDPFHEDDFRSHQELKRETDCLVVGDDLFVTSHERLERGIDTCNAIIIKPNQAGTVSRTKKTLETARENDYTPIISHRSGETCDTSISSLALEWSIPIIKAGIADIRVAKLNRLLLEWQRMEDDGKNPEMADLD